MTAGRGDTGVVERRQPELLEAWNGFFGHEPQKKRTPMILVFVKHVVGDRPLSLSWGSHRNSGRSGSSPSPRH